MISLEMRRDRRPRAGARWLAVAV